MADINYDEITKGIVLVNGDLSFTSDISVTEGIRQNAIAFLHTFKGESFVDSAYGIDWVNEVFQAKPFNPEGVDRVVREGLLRIKGIATVENISLDFTRGDRHLEIAFVCLTDTGALIKENIQIP
jgi:hypothetical protein